MSELITMCVQEEERLKEEKSDMVHLTIGPNKKAFKKGKNIRKKKKQGNDVSYVYLIHEKFEALDVFKIYKTKVENQLNR